MSLLPTATDDNRYSTITVENIIEAVQKQNKNKAAGLDGIYKESYMYGCNRLYISLLFNLFIKYCYVSESFFVVIDCAPCKI